MIAAWNISIIVTIREINPILRTVGSMDSPFYESKVVFNKCYGDEIDGGRIKAKSLNYTSSPGRYGNIGVGDFQMHVFSDEEGETAVRIARKTIAKVIHGENPGEMDVPESFRENGGVFTTITRYPSGSLRGCIGYSEPVMPIISAIIRSARSAATKDFRFLPVKPDEIETIIVSVSLLTKPVRVVFDKPEDLPELIEIGKHGLIVKKNHVTGLLLPQVPVEQGWDSKVFLNQVCVKAGMPYKSWKNKKVELYTFTAEVFEETEPNGPVARMDTLH